MPKLETLTATLEGYYEQLEETKEQFKDQLVSLEMQKHRLLKRLIDAEDKCSKTLMRIQNHEDFPEDGSVQIDDETGEAKVVKPED